MDKSDPLSRLQKFFERHDEMAGGDLKTLEDKEKMAVINAMRKADRKPGLLLEHMFEDVYHEMPQSLIDQQSELKEHLRKNPNQY